ncbi:helix-turn-helix transcriptional regulator [Lujinxingia vulgaris]|uniref:Helix-turn-helix transcriptional regulator n=1 Tax=Lujinxingia vulgaris TaxID=2600176 RepID=A0A5C6XAW7_9DELT|nr:helix-turn-helix transcriptional regulator [Lujinxingia vulgaris]TXD35206.1 helix-turn-helix transcriptional regulator [Lujinxingia vulgaris]
MPLYWQRLSDALSALAIAPQHHPNLLAEAIAEQAACALAGHRAFLLIITRDRVLPRNLKSEPIQGWTPIHNYATGTTPMHQARIQEWMRTRVPLNDVPSSVAIARSAGLFRVLLREDLIEARAWDQTPSGEMLEMLGSGDRMIGALPCSETVEIVIGVDRAIGQPVFNHDDQLALARFMERCGPYLVRVLMSHGLLSHQAPLTPRERECYELLLDSLTEREIAEVMGLTPRSAHQYVSRIYQKLGLNSRAQLMSEWLIAGQIFEDMLPFPLHPRLAGARGLRCAEMATSTAAPV